MLNDQGGGGETAKYYYTTTAETPSVYHTNEKCSGGEKIEAKNRVNTDIAPIG